MNILITGSAGFIAPHVAQAFTSRGHSVVRTDIRASDGIVRSELTSLESMLDITRGVDIVCHLGGVGDVYLAINEPYTAASANVLGTAILLEACLRNKVRKVVYASTWEVYGEPHYQPIDEVHPCNPDHPYNITKLAGERLVMAYDKLKGLPGVALRLGTAYGTGMRPNSVFSLFINKALAGQPITIKGTGQQSRQFTHAKDIARGFLLAAESDVHGDVFNLVAGEDISIQQLAEKVAQALPTQIVYEPARAGDVPPARVNATKVHKVLGWQPQVQFDEGLSEIIAAHIPQVAVAG